MKITLWILLGLTMAFMVQTVEGKGQKPKDCKDEWGRPVKPGEKNDYCYCPPRGGKCIKRLYGNKPSDRGE
jgi:hypothetical protein